MPVSPCFSYPTDAPPGTASPGSAHLLLAGVRRMPVTCYGYPITCFSRPDDVPPDGIRDAAQPSLSDVRKVPGGACFRY